MARAFGRTIALSLSLAVLLVFTQSAAVAQYKVTKLVADQPGHAPHIDPNLKNAWGLAFGPTSPIWVSDNDTGVSTLYDGMGNPQSLVVTIPRGAASMISLGSPTGIVFNSSSNFVVTENGKSGVAFFIFATADGTISGWSPGVDLTNAIIAVDNSKSLSSYTGLAILNNAANGESFLYAADAGNNRVDIFDGKFNLVKSFTDTTIPAGFAPYGIQVFNENLVFVTYASTGNAPGGFIDVFGRHGGFVKRLASGGKLNQPWGMALAPNNFGPFSNALLVSNNLPNGTINAFDFNTGKFLGQLKNRFGQIISIDQLWGLAFGQQGGGNGRRNQLFFTAGPNNYANGRLGVIEFAPLN